MASPNVIMITCHDLGQHLGCYGVDSVQTPNIDNLAASGVRFENFYSTSAVCSPARGSLHTGRYPQCNGLMGLTHGPWWWRINDDEQHTAQILKEEGYKTYLIGFNHIAPDNPGRLGYDQCLSEDKKALETVNETVNLIKNRQEKEEPFFAKVGFTEVHRPFTRGEDRKNGVFVPPYLVDSEQVRNDFAAFQETIRFFDECVGQIINALKESKIFDNTLVIFASDHGIPYVGAKWSLRKAGIEVPLIMYQPGTVLSGGRVYEDLMSNVDFLPTLLDLLEIEIPENIQGVSFNGLLTGEVEQGPRKEVYAQFTPAMKRDNESRSILTERFHLIRYFDAGRTVPYPVDVHPQNFAAHTERCKTGWEPRPFVQLFDIKNDPYELEDLGGKEKYKELVKDLSSKLMNWMKETDDPLLKGALANPYYKKAMEDFRKEIEA